MIIDKRIELGKPTVVTSNLSLSQISQLIDDRLASRLASFELIEMKGEDKRLTGLIKPKIVNF
jgi:DNA replication protein DnaC